jgi:hypothetical protein
MPHSSRVINTYTCKMLNPTYVGNRDECEHLAKMGYDVKLGHHLTSHSSLKSVNCNHAMYGLKRGLNRDVLSSTCASIVELNTCMGKRIQSKHKKKILVIHIYMYILAIL